MARVQVETLQLLVVMANRTGLAKAAEELVAGLISCAVLGSRGGQEGWAFSLHGVRAGVGLLLRCGGAWAPRVTFHRS